VTRRAAWPKLSDVIPTVDSMKQKDNLLDIDFVCILVCDVCEGEITTPEGPGGIGCCRACGIAYAFDLAERPGRAVTA